MRTIIRDEEMFLKAKQALATARSLSEFAKTLRIPLGSASAAKRRLEISDNYKEYLEATRQDSCSRVGLRNEDVKQRIAGKTGEALYWGLKSALRRGASIKLCHEFCPGLSKDDLKRIVVSLDYEEWLELVRQKSEMAKQVLISEGVFCLVKSGAEAGYTVDEIAKETGIALSGIARILRYKNYEGFCACSVSRGKRQVSRRAFELYKQGKGPLPNGMQRFARLSRTYEEFCIKAYLGKDSLSWWDSKSCEIDSKKGEPVDEKNAEVSIEKPAEVAELKRKVGSKGVELRVLAKADCEIVIKIIDL